MLTRPPTRPALAALAFAIGTFGLGSAGAGAAPATVAIASYAFGPAQATISAGDTVTWINNDTAVHDVLSTGGSGPIKSPKLAKGQTYAQSFATAGTFRYVCTLHPDMLGAVTVKAVSPVPAAKPAAPAAAAPAAAPAAAVPAAAVPAAAKPSSAATPATTATPPATGAAEPALAAPPAAAPSVGGPAEVALAEAAAEPATATSSDVGRARVHPLLFLAAVVTAVVVGGTISLVEASRRWSGPG